MQRLTERLANGVIKRVEVSDGNRGDCVMSRLAAYEDILFDADGNERISLDRLETICAAEKDGRCVTPCDVCRYNPPSSCDGKPCIACPASAKEAAPNE